MSSNSPKIKLGVLNMTICFDKLKSRDSSSNKKSHLSSKTQQIPTFIPRYSSHRHKATLSIDNKMNPFQQYVNNKNQSIRYLKQQQKQAQKSIKKIIGFTPINNTIQLQINDKLLDEQHTFFNYNNFMNDNNIQMIINKKHLRNRIDKNKQKIKIDQKLIFNFKQNPQQNLKNIFTIRTAKTSSRNRINRQYNRLQSRQYNRLYNRQQIFTHRLSYGYKDQNKSMYWKQQDIKKIRPWSTSKNWQTKISMFQSDILDNSAKNTIK